MAELIKRRDFLRNCTAAMSVLVAGQTSNNFNPRKTDNARTYLDSSKRHGSTPNQKVLRDLSSNTNFWDGLSDSVLKTIGIGWGDNKLGAREAAMLEDACHYYDEIERLDAKPNPRMNYEMDELELSLDGEVKGKQKSKFDQFKFLTRILKALGIGTSYGLYNYFSANPNERFKAQFDFISKHPRLDQAKKDAIVKHLSSLYKNQNAFSSGNKAFFFTLLALYLYDYNLKLPYFHHCIQDELAYVARKSFRESNELEIMLAKNFNTLLGKMVPPEMGESSFNKDIVLTLTPRPGPEIETNRSFYYQQQVLPVVYIDSNTLIERNYSPEDAEVRKGFYIVIDKIAFRLNEIDVRYFKTAKFTLSDRDDGDSNDETVDDQPLKQKLPKDIQVSRNSKAPFILAS